MVNYLYSIGKTHFDYNNYIRVFYIMGAARVWLYNSKTKQAKARLARKKKLKSRRGKTWKSPMSVVKGLVPETKLYSLPYVDNQTMDAAAYPDVLSYFYVANSIFDPVYAVGGHQPMYHD